MHILLIMSIYCIKIKLNVSTCINCPRRSPQDCSMYRIKPADGLPQPQHSRFQKPFLTPGTGHTIH